MGDLPHEIFLLVGIQELNKRLACTLEKLVFKDKQVSSDIKG
jgi:hypothetical protein